MKFATLIAAIALVLGSATVQALDFDGPIHQAELRTLREQSRQMPMAAAPSMAVETRNAVGEGEAGMSQAPAKQNEKSE